MSTMLFQDCFLIDCTGAEPKAGASVVVEDKRIKDVIPSGKVTGLPADTVKFALKGRTLMAGLTDAHVHMFIAHLNLQTQVRTMSATEVALRAARCANQLLMNGYTTVRDACGADFGFKQAGLDGFYQGPRLIVAGAALTQTGGHGDIRSRFECGPPGAQMCGCGQVCLVVDNPSGVRLAVRELIRQGVDWIKILAAGGVLSETDPIDSVQFSLEEQRAIVQAAADYGRDVMAHAHVSKAIIRAVKAGVRSVEHATMLDVQAAAAVKEVGAFIVPTLLVMDATWKHAKEWGLGAAQIEKLSFIRGGALGSLELAYKQGLKIGHGTDYMGEMTGVVSAAAELTLRTQVMPAMQVLVNATKTNAELFRMEKLIGTVEPGKLADLIVVDGNPLDKMSVLEDPNNVLLVMKEGQVYKKIL